MSTTDQFIIGMQAYQDIKAELHQAGINPSDGAGEGPIESAGTKPSPIPDGSLLLGFAEDGLPVILDLYNPMPGPLLVAGDGGSGKTAVLQSIARSSNLQDPGDVQFAVITSFLEEWAALEGLPNSLGVWPAGHPATADFLSQLVGWADAISSTRQVILLLIDGLDQFLAEGHPARQDLLWLLTCGPERHIWPVATVNPARLSRLHNWLDYFNTRILGQVRNIRNVRLLVDDPVINLGDLVPSSLFGLYQPDSWLRFLLPPLRQGD